MRMRLREWLAVLACFAALGVVGEMDRRDAERAQQMAAAGRVEMAGR